MDSDGPTTPETLASNPNIEVPDLADVSQCASHSLPYSIPILPPLSKAANPHGLAPVSSWQSILDAIGAL